MKKTKNRDDKIMTRTSTTASLGLSTSANLTTASSGPEGDDSTSYFPEFHEEKSWSSKTTSLKDEDK